MSTDDIYTGPDSLHLIRTETRSASLPRSDGSGNDTMYYDIYRHDIDNGARNVVMSESMFLVMLVCLQERCEERAASARISREIS